MHGKHVIYLFILVKTKNPSLELDITGQHSTATTKFNNEPKAFRWSLVRGTSTR